MNTVTTGSRSGLRLPNHAYVPGKNARHDEDAFDFAREQAPMPTTSRSAAQNPAWLYGLDLFEAGYYWEAHEVLEQVWMNAPANTPEKKFVQAVIQLANAALKQVMGREKAALRLCDLTETKLEEAYGCRASKTLMGLDKRAVTVVIDRTRRAVQANRVARLSFDPTNSAL